MATLAVLEMRLPSEGRDSVQSRVERRGPAITRSRRNTGPAKPALVSFRPHAPSPIVTPAVSGKSGRRRACAREVQEPMPPPVPTFPATSFGWPSGVRHAALGPEASRASVEPATSKGVLQSPVRRLCSQATSRRIDLGDQLGGSTRGKLRRWCTLPQVAPSQ